MAITLKGYTANYLGLSTDAKPTKADDNAIFRELDTGKRYYFTGAAWAEIPSSGGGGGGDVTSVNGKTGAVTLTASDVGAYTTAETDALLGDKQNKTLSASVKIGTETETTVEGAIDEVAAVIPATAATSNKLSTAADTAKEDITATANSEDITLTDSTDARVHDLRIYGKTENGHSVGENGLTVTACGKNLFNINGKVNAGHHWNKTPRWYTDYDGTDKNTVENGVLIANANFSNVNPWGQIIKIKKNIYYTVSFKCISFGSGTGAAIAIYGYTPEQSGADIIYSNFITELNTIKTFKIKSTSYEGDTVFGFGSRDASGAQFADIMIQEGWHDVGYFEYENYKGFIVAISSALPLRGSYGTIDLGNLNWTYQTTAQPGDPCSLPRFGTNLGVVPDAYIPSVEFGVEMSSCSSRYTPAVDPVLGGNTDKTICFGKGKGVYVVDHDYTDAAAFKAAVTGITLTYPSYCDEIDLADGVAITRLNSNGDVLATPVTTPLSDAEKAAFAEFRTFDGNTNVTATDDPFMTLNYVKNTDNGKALADVDDKSAVRMAMIAAPYDDKATYAVGDYCTYGERLWKCNTAIATAEPFTAAHWTATTVMEEI